MPYFVRSVRPPQFFCIEQLHEWVGEAGGIVGESAKGKVRQHAAATDAAKAVDKKLRTYSAAPGYRSEEPTDRVRFVLESPDRSTFEWFELHGARLVRASGAMRHLGTTEETAIDLASPDHARAHRDELARDLLVAGYTVKTFEIGPPVPPRSKSAVDPGALAPFLERLGASPEDDETWRALGDWLLANDPDGGVLVERERAGKPIERMNLSSRTTNKRLFGVTTGLVIDSLMESTWRSAHLVACRLSTSRGSRIINESELFAACGRAPAFALLGSLDLEFTYIDALDSLGGFSHVRALRLASRNESSLRRGALSASWLDRFPAVRALTLKNVELDGDALPVGVETLVLQHPWHTSLLARALPGVRSLEIDLRIDTATTTAALLDDLVARAPRLTSLHVVTPPVTRDVDYPSRFLDALERSPVLPRLRQLVIDTREARIAVPSDARAAFRGGALRHLEHLELGERYVRVSGSL